MESRNNQIRFPRPIKDSEQGERNSRLFLKAKVIQAFRQLHPDRDYFLIFLENYLHILILVKQVLRNNFG